MDNFGDKIKESTVYLAEKTTDFFKLVGKKASDMIEEGMIASRIREINKSISLKYETLGRNVYNGKGRLSKPAASKKLITEIEEDYKKIQNLRKALAKIKGETYCEKCHSYNPGDSLFCNKCGNELSAEIEKEVEEVLDSLDAELNKVPETIKNSAASIKGKIVELTDMAKDETSELVEGVKKSKSIKSIKLDSADEIEEITDSENKNTTEVKKEQKKGTKTKAKDKM